MTTAVREVEDKFAVDAGFLLPDLDGVAGIEDVSAPEVVELDATYYDTPDLALVRNRLTLRRRTGGDDQGWHLKLPVKGGRDELRRPLGRTKKVPRPMADLVFARTGGVELVPVARLQTTRTVRQLCGSDGVVLAEVADDVVRAQALGVGEEPAELLQWREIEVELVDGDTKLLSKVGDRLRAAGARPARVGSKVAQVLADRLPPAPDVPVPGKLTRKSPAGEVVRAYLSAQLQQLLNADVRLRLEDPEGIHDVRVAMRRIRSTLRTFHSLLDLERAQDLEDRLRDLAATLGGARDAEVLLERLEGELARQPEELVLGPVQRRLQSHLQGQMRSGRKVGLEALRSPEYAALIRDLIAFVHDGVVGDRANAPAKKVLPKLVRRNYRKLAQRVEHTADVLGEERDLAVHSARKAGKRLRYAAEALVPAFGTDADDFARQVKRVQEVLGEHQDSVVAQHSLKQLALKAHAQAEESSFTFALLIGVEQGRAAEARAEMRSVWREASRKKRRRWLKS